MKRDLIYAEGVEREYAETGLGWTITTMRGASPRPLHHKHGGDLMANRRAGNLVAKHPPRQCKVCNRVFVPQSGRALYCPMCRIKGYKWIKEQLKTKEVLRDE